MSLIRTREEDLSVEECLDQLGDALQPLQGYPPAVLAVALRVHLGALLQALLETGVCTSAQLRAFVRELENEALGGVDRS